MRLGGEPRRGDAPRPQVIGSELFGNVNPLHFFGGVLFYLSLFLVVWSCFGNVEITEYGLRASLITRKVEATPYTSGRHFIGPLNYFIKFPAVVKTIQFSDSKMQGDLASDERGDPLLRSRTKDGLDVTIELSFQYQLKKDKIYALYTTLGAGLDFHNTYIRIAIDRLTEIATEYTANEFFTDRTRIGKDMETRLRQDFEKTLYGTIFSFQLRSVGLPQEFEEAIQQTEVEKQRVQIAGAEQTSARVALETKLMQAKRRQQVRSNKAEAYAQSVMLRNTADIQQFTTAQHKTADSYEKVLEALDSQEPDLLAYVQSRVVRDHPGDKMTLGLSLPAVTLT